MTGRSILLFCFLLWNCFFSEGGRIVSLPGLKREVHFAQYSGYMTLSGTKKHMHYWFTESTSKPSSDPLILWLTGGPGCSSLLAMFTENGPFNLDKDGSLSMRDYSWNKLANVIWLESPVGVGFSYSDNTSDYTTDDDQTSLDSYQFLLQFFQEFPQFAHNDFFIAGESYAGHYVPQLAERIMNGNAAGRPFINLKAVSAGNPSTDHLIDGQYYVPFLHQHALIGIRDFQNMTKLCKNNFVDNNDAACQSAIKKGFLGMSDRINPYDIYGRCDGPGPSSPGYCFTAMSLLGNLGNSVGTVGNSMGTLGAGSQTVIPCINTTLITNYFNRPEVQKAIFVESGRWDICSQILNYKWKPGSMIPIYEKLVQKYRVLIYSGDVDSCVNYLGTQTAALEIKDSGEQEDWKAWMVDDQVGGYKIILGDHLQYLTVKGAGHMVPMYKPKEAFTMLQRFLKNVPI
eukprot:TRINITY_DN2884_c1_g1_i1.p1 TRINITY_DN2884_c1_g1~~TRINITY_DN2884_c1_g1_i1.p1  ORF type:complete len:457 (-),score=98.49 TRINITY_DN2884_c1_g1_i1:7-1377(-)